MYLINLQSAVSLFNLSLRPLRLKKKADSLGQFSKGIANQFNLFGAKYPVANSAIPQKA